MNDSRGRLSLVSVTDAVLFERIGSVRDHHKYLVFSCPENPMYRWGNRICFLSPELVHDVDQCEEIMANEFCHQSLIQHHAFSWDMSAYEDFPSELWESVGYEIDKSDTLCMSDKPSITSDQTSEVVVRTLVEKKEWSDAYNCQLDVRSSHWSEREFEAYLRPKFAAYRGLVAKGRARWFGAFSPDEIQMGNLGVLWCEDESVNRLIARFQMVATHPQYQGQGVCTRLLKSSIDHIFAYAADRGFKDVTAVIVADPDYRAKRIYQRVGFKDWGHQVIVTKRCPLPADRR